MQQQIAVNSSFQTGSSNSPARIKLLKLRPSVDSRILVCPLKTYPQYTYLVIDLRIGKRVELRSHRSFVLGLAPVSCLDVGDLAVNARLELPILRSSLDASGGSFGGDLG